MLSLFSKRERLLVITVYSEPCKGLSLAPGITKSQCQKESGRRIFLLHADSSESERGINCVLIQHKMQLLERWKSNRINFWVKSDIWLQQRFHEGMRLPLKEVFTELFLASEWPCSSRDVCNQMCTVLDKDDQEAQSMLQIILEWRLCHARLTQRPEQVPSSSRQEEWARPRFSKNLDWTVQNQTKKKIQDLQRAKWPERRNWREEEIFPWSLW